MAQLKSTVVQGSLRVTDTTYTTNLNLSGATAWGVIYADNDKNIINTSAGTAGYLLQGNGAAAPSWIQATNSNIASTIVKRDSNGDFSARTITAALTGNASSATKWASAQTVYVALGTASKTTTIQGGNSNAVALGIDGTLAIGHGGTGITTTDAHKVLIGPSSGNAAAPTWRTIVADDLPTATTSAFGITKLSSASSSTEEGLAATPKGVWAAINTLDGNLNSTSPGAGKTLTAFSQTNGKVSATFGNISITASQAGLGDVSNNADLNGASGAKGDIIYWSAENTPAHLTNTTSTTKHFLSITSQVPAWSTVSKSDVGLENVTNDAQVKASLGTAKGDILYWSAKSTPARLAIGSNGRFLTVSSGAPAWAVLPTADSSTAGIMKLGASGGAATYEHTHKIDGATGSTITRYGVCSTSASNPDKSVTITNGTFTLETGARVTVKFTNGQERPASFSIYMTLNVNGTGAKTIYRDTQIPIVPYFDWSVFSDNLLDFVYDGTHWVIVGINDQWTRTIFYEDFTINSLNISTNGTTNYTVTLDSTEAEILAVNIKRAWPLDNWANGALVNITQWDPAGNTVSFALSTTSAQNYGVIIRVLYYEYR